MFGHQGADLLLVNEIKTGLKLVTLKEKDVKIAKNM